MESFLYCLSSSELNNYALRTTALGTASAGARVGSLLSPLIAMLDQYDPIAPFLIYGTVVLVAVLISLWLWPETSKRSLPETLEEAEKAAQTPNQWLRCCLKKTEDV